MVFLQYSYILTIFTFMQFVKKYYSGDLKNLNEVS